MKTINCKHGIFDTCCKVFLSIANNGTHHTPTPRKRTYPTNSRKKT